MFVDYIKNRFKKNKVVFDIFDNEDDIQTKNAINEFIYFFIEYIQGLKSNNLYSSKYIEVAEEILNYNKDALIMYLRLMIDVLSDQNIDEEFLEKEDISYIVDLKGNLKFDGLNEKKVILRQIRNVYAHKSGKISFFVEEGIRKVKFENKGWFSIKMSLNDFNKLFENLSIVNEKNEVKKIIFDTIKCIEESKYSDISEKATIIILMNLLMCYNKESIFDTFMKTQSSFINASNFQIDTTKNWNYNEEMLRKMFFDNYDIIFQSAEDKESYINEWKSIVDMDDSIVTSGLNYTYKIDNMPFDTYTKKHIPIPIFLNCLRNANCHGRIMIQGDDFVFFDARNGNNDKPYFFMKISKNDLLKFLSNDYFVESLLTTVDEHKKKNNENFYLLEEAESANGISNYINIYRNRLPHLTENELLQYMYDNNKFSSYLMEHPEQTVNFLRYELADNIRLVSVLASFQGLSYDDLCEEINNCEEVYNFQSLCMREGMRLYGDYLLKCKCYDTEVRSDIDDNFFDVYYSFIKNVRSFEKNIKFKDINGLPEEKKSVIRCGSEELKKEFYDNDILLDYSDASLRILIEIGFQLSDRPEIDKIIAACWMGELKEKIEENENPKERKYTIMNIEKYSSRAHVYESSATENIKKHTKSKKIWSTAIKANIAVHLFNAGYSYLGLMSGFLPPELVLFTYPMSVFISNITLNEFWKNLSNKTKKINECYELLDRYSVTENGDDIDEIRNNGQSKAR